MIYRGCIYALGILAAIHSAHTYDLYHIHITSLSPYNGYKLNSHLTCFQRGFIAQLVEHCTSIMEVMGLNPFAPSEFFLGFLCNWFSCFITARITFTCKKNYVSSSPPQLLQFRNHL